MNDATIQSDPPTMIPAGEAVVIRDRYLAPSLLAPFADDMARRLSRLSIGPLLETVADTGTLTQAIASALSAGLTIISTDPDIETLRFAAGKPGMARINWQQADPTHLPFADASFGIVACHFGIATIRDRVQAYKEARRVIKFGGRMIFTVPAALRHNPVADCIQRALEALFPADPPTTIMQILHGYADNQKIDDDLTDAGFTDAIYTSVELPFAAASARDVAIGYCLGTGLRAEIAARVPDSPEPIVAALTAALEKRFGTGAIDTSMRAHFISAAG